MRVKTETRRNTIIAVAWDLFRKDGYERTTMSAIAARLGGSKGTLYGYFSSKEELLLATVDYVLAARGETAFEKLESAGSLAARLTDFARVYIALRAHPDTIALDRIAIAEAGRSNIGQVMQERLLLPQWHRFAEHLHKEAEQGRLQFEDADEVAAVFRALLTLPLLEQCLVNDTMLNEQDIAAHATRSVRTFLNAYGAQQS
jgi:AcrR family transcriptional regulator